MDTVIQLGTLLMLLATIWMMYLLFLWITDGRSLNPYRDHHLPRGTVRLECPKCDFKEDLKDVRDLRIPRGGSLNCKCGYKFISIRE